MPVLYPTFTTLVAELGDTIGRTLQKLLNATVNGRPTSSGTALASATRSATTLSSNIPCAGFRGIIVYLDVTAASGTGGLTVRLFGRNPITTNIATVAAVTTAATTSGLRIYLFAPGAGSVNGATVAWGAAGVALGSEFAIQVLHGDASNYTYQVNYELIP